MSGVNLTDADLSFANLSSTNLSNSILHDIYSPSSILLELI